MKKLDLAGKTFGQIRVIQEVEGKRGGSRWLCECLRCGRTFETFGYRLTTKRNPPQNCGCLRREQCADLTGRTFGALTVLRLVAKSHDSIYLCRCNLCGREKEFPACTIKAAPKGCGCLREHPFAFNNVEGASISALSKTGGDNNSTGYRWVAKKTRKGSVVYYAEFSVRGRIYRHGGFASPETAHQWALTEKQRVIFREGLEEYIDRETE